MLSWKLFVCTVITMVVVLMCAATANSAPVDDQFELTVMPVPADMYVLSPIPSYASRTVSALCSSTGRYDDTMSAVQFEIGEDGLIECFSTPSPRSAEPSPKLIIDTDSVLMSMRDPEVERTGDPRVGLVYQLFKPESGEYTDVTPGNLVETTPWLCRGGTPLLWSDELGLTWFNYERETHQVVVWQGRETLSNVQRTPVIIACGDTFIDGIYTRVEITEDGQVLAFNWETGLLEESSRHAALGAEVAKVIDAPQDKPERIAMSQDVAVLRIGDEDTIYTIISSDGSRKHIKHFDDESEDQEIPALLQENSREELIEQWNSFSDDEKKAIAGEVLLGYRRGGADDLPADIVDALSYITPIDDQHVGIMDTTLQRLVVIGPADM